MIKNGYVSFILVIIFCLIPQTIFADFAGFCMYEHPSNSNLKIGVTNNGSVYLYDFSGDIPERTKEFANSVWTNFTSEVQDTTAYKTGHSFGFGNCPKRLAYITAPNDEVFFHPFADEVIEIINSRSGAFKNDDSRIVGQEFPGLRDVIRVNHGHCWTGTYNVSPDAFNGETFNEADEICRELGINPPATFSMNSYDLNVSWTNWSNLSQEEVDELDEERAKEERKKAYNQLNSCWIEHGYNNYDGRNVIGDCFQEAHEETLKAAECVRREIGEDYQCDGAHLNYEEKQDSYINMMQAKWIVVDLTELKCEQVLGEHNSEMRQFLLRMFYLILGIGMAILIVMSSLDYAKVVSSGNEDSEVLVKAHKRVLTRLGIFALLLFLPIILLFVFELLGDILGVYENCLEELF